VQRATIQQQQLQFGMAAPTFTPTTSGLINSRWVATVPLNPNPPPPQLSYTLITATTANPPPPAAACLNTDPAFTALPPKLEYRQGSRDEWKLLSLNNNRKDYLATDISVTECISNMFKLLRSCLLYIR
jgi:hypothetical protein